MTIRAERSTRDLNPLPIGAPCAHPRMGWCCGTPCGHLRCPDCGLGWDEAAEGDGAFAAKRYRRQP
jgi:hypothetical protein